MHPAGQGSLSQGPWLHMIATVYPWASYEIYVLHRPGAEGATHVRTETTEISGGLGSPIFSVFLHLFFSPTLTPLSILLVLLPPLPSRGDPFCRWGLGLREYLPYMFLFCIMT